MGLSLAGLWNFWGGLNTPNALPRYATAHL